MTQTYSYLRNEIASNSWKRQRKEKGAHFCSGETINVMPAAKLINKVRHLRDLHRAHIIYFGRMTLDV